MSGHGTGPNFSVPGGNLKTGFSTGGIEPDAGSGDAKSFLKEGGNLRTMEARFPSCGAAEQKPPTIEL